MKPAKIDCETQHCVNCDGWNPATEENDCPGVHVYPERERARRIEDALESAWCLIANAGQGDWENETTEWEIAARRWRNNYLSLLPAKNAVAEALDP